VKEGVQTALGELEDGLSENRVESKEDGDGGAFVLVHGIEVGDSFDPTVSWIGFHLTFTCPEADVYPLYLDPALRYVGEGPTPNQHPDGPLPVGITRGATMPGFELPAIQVSRRSTDSEADTPLRKLRRVIDFLRTR
jgi:hypothetical protein